MTAHSVMVDPAREAPPSQVVVLAPDRLDELGVIELLRQGEEFSLMPARRARHADLLVVVAGSASELLFQQVQQLELRPGAPVVLFLDQIEGVRLPPGISPSTCTVAPRGRLTSDRFAATLRSATSAGRGVPTAGPEYPADFDQREVAVLTLVAQGFENAEIARRLNYSERTIKYVLAGLMTRHGLRNRAHAVAQAIRTGLI
ncbi:LuxR C-terminal-related transcriptional regulator [Kineosporia sp. NBRC 101731]|uniref:helix-turn-helix transcriptional regulator n=1 Tax=Kineosporia sp. NBRC 101731 TaxID=3032199 RepID=UPI002553332C|nr:LuxR C-terminal-related transcriptional regulator [Kineosporia sp. NBRC 101731]